MDWVDGVQVPDRLVTEDEHVSGHVGGLVVLGGVTVEISGHQGSVRLEPGARAVVRNHQGSLHVDDAEASIVGSHQGSLHVGDDARVVVEGSQQGSVHVSRGGFVEVRPGARAQGSLHVEGRLINRGRRGGSVSGSGSVEDLDGGIFVPPVVRDGVTYNES